MKLRLPFTAAILLISAVGAAEVKVSRPSSSILSGKARTELGSATDSSGTSRNSPPPPSLIACAMPRSSRVRKPERSTSRRPSGVSAAMSPIQMRRISEAVAHARLLRRRSRCWSGSGDSRSPRPSSGRRGGRPGSGCVRRQAAVEPDRRRAEPGLQRGDIDEAPGNPSASGAGSESRIRPCRRSTWSGSSPGCGTVPISDLGRGRRCRRGLRGDEERCGGEQQSGEAEFSWE